MIVKDAMVLIHLSKTTLLEKACDLFEDVIIPELVYRESVTEGKERGYEDSLLIESLIKKSKIKVKKIVEVELLKRLLEFNIQGGEAESVALYWQERADLIASDDSNIIRKRELLNINLVGTPAIILTLYKKKLIEKEKLNTSIKKLRDIGWFNGSILDKILMEVEKYG